MNDHLSTTPTYGASMSEPAVPTPTHEEIPFETRSRILSSANWFFWIAALSVINSASAHFGADWGFIIGLGVTQIADVVLGTFGSTGTFIAVVFDLLAASVFVAIGLLARRFVQWPFVLGMVLYAFDGLLFVLVGDILSIGFHVFALYCIFLGFKALRNVRAGIVPPPANGSLGI
jgi:hypothetical protein